MAILLKRILSTCVSVLCLVNFSNGAPLNKTIFDQRQTGEYNIQISLKDIRIFALLSGGLGGPEDYDYNYDYSEMTIKPQKVNGTTSTTPASTAPVKGSSTTPEADVESTTERIVEITPSTLPTSTQSPVPWPILIHIDSNNATTTSKNQTLLINNTTVQNRPIFSPSTIQPLTVRPDYSTGIPVKVIVTPLETVSNTVKRGSDGEATNLELSQTSSAINVNNGTKVRRADCAEGFRKDRQGNCRPRAKKPQQQTLLRKLIQLSQRLQPSRQKTGNTDNVNN